MIFDQQHRAGTGGKNKTHPPAEIYRLNLRRRQRFARRDQREANMAVVGDEFVAWLKIGDLSGEPGAQSCGTRIADGGKTARPRNELAACRCEIRAGARQNPQPGDDHAASHAFKPRRKTAAKL